jgi:NAD(P)-dependent dehydrogenase (short-subunit alcohol dehydrogenase family)
MNGRVVLVTGALTGIRKATAMALFCEGDCLIVAELR